MSTVTWATIEDWVRRREPESETLDFKKVFWHEKANRSRHEEIAKDVVAMMNARGGVVLVGISDEDDAASGFSGAALPEHADQLVRQAVDKHIVPREAGGGVHVHVLRHGQGAEQREILVVRVDPWPHGPVALRNGDLQTYRLPIRRGTHTEDIGWEEAMRSLDGAHRRTRLRFAAWHEEDPKAGVFFGSGLRVASGSQTASVPVFANEPFARIGAVREDVIELIILRTEYVVWLVVKGMLFDQYGAPLDDPSRGILGILDNAMTKTTWDRQTDHRVAVPYEFVRAVWPEGAGSPLRIHMVLDADLLYAGGTWLLKPTPR